VRTGVLSRVLRTSFTTLRTAYVGTSTGRVEWEAGDVKDVTKRTKNVPSNQPIISHDSDGPAEEVKIRFCAE